MRLHRSASASSGTSTWNGRTALPVRSATALMAGLPLSSDAGTRVGAVRERRHRDRDARRGGRDERPRPACRDAGSPPASSTHGRGGPFPGRQPRAAAASRCTSGSGSVARAAADLRAEPGHRVVLAVHHPLLERDDAVVGEVDALRADLGAALGDVAVAQAELLLRRLPPVPHVQRVHVELRQPDEEARAGEGLLVLLVVTDDVAGVLTEVALDALA